MEEQTILEKRISELPVELSMEEEFNLLRSLSSYLQTVEESKYLMLINPYPKNELYNTVFELSCNFTMLQARQIIEFINKHVGNIQGFENMGDRFDFYCDNKFYSLFDFTGGVIHLD